MNDTKNILLAWASTLSPLLSLGDAYGAVNILSAIVLPVVLFAAGKAIDVWLQIQLRGRRPRRRRNQK